VCDSEHKTQDASVAAADDDRKWSQTPTLEPETRETMMAFEQATHLSEDQTAQTQESGLIRETGIERIMNAIPACDSLRTRRARRRTAAPRLLRDFLPAGDIDSHHTTATEPTRESGTPNVERAAAATSAERSRKYSLGERGTPLSVADTGTLPRPPVRTIAAHCNEGILPTPEERAAMVWDEDKAGEICHHSL